MCCTRGGGDYTGPLISFIIHIRHHVHITSKWNLRLTLYQFSHPVWYRKVEKNWRAASDGDLFFFVFFSPHLPTNCRGTDMASKPMAAAAFRFPRISITGRDVFQSEPHTPETHAHATPSLIPGESTDEIAVESWML